MNSLNTGNLLLKLRTSAGLTQKDIANKLGISRPKYQTLESGKSELSLSEIRQLAELYQISPGEIVEGKLLPVDNTTMNREFLLAQQSEATIVPREIDPKVDPEKLKNVLLYILSNVGARPNVGEAVLYKLLYFIDFDYYELNGCSITGLSYVRNHHGPTPAKEFSHLIEYMKEAKELEVVETPYFSFIQKKYLPIKHADLSSLSASEIKHIDAVLDRLASKSATELTELSHKDTPWIATKPNERIDYQLAMYRTDETSLRVFDDDL